jgi:hypothetical protein
MATLGQPNSREIRAHKLWHPRTSTAKKRAGKEARTEVAEGLFESSSLTHPGYFFTQFGCGVSHQDNSAV